MVIRKETFNNQPGHCLILFTKLVHAVTIKTNLHICLNWVVGRACKHEVCSTFKEKHDSLKFINMFCGRCFCHLQCELNVVCGRITMAVIKTIATVIQKFNRKFYVKKFNLWIEVSPKVCEAFL